ncbi:MAG: fumarylacetoacetase [Acidimicrobiaceae bacterium]|nr:fumarylacetoacetase [Acidimicrobiaceae bacterium]
MTVVAIPDESPFPITNLPFGIGDPGDGHPRAWVAVGDHAVDLDALHAAGVFHGIGIPPTCFARGDLNAYLALGRDVWSSVRARLRDALEGSSLTRVPERSIVRRSRLRMDIPTRPVDYVDFYSSIHHATNLGRMFRPDGDALLPNWRRIPIGYHGRTGTLVPDGTPVRRPAGYRLVDGEPEVGPSGRLDIELEVGTVVGVGNAVGEPIPIGRAVEHIYGMCLVNDWSARDIQAFEYQPLGPFLGKSFATSVSPWLVSLEALEPFRVAPPTQDPPPADYLTTDEPWGFDLHLEVWLDTEAMRAAGLPPVCISETGFADMYWTPAQQLAHLTVNGAATHPGDLFASGTVSGAELGSEGSLIELAANGDRPIRLPDGTERAFLHDGDRVELRGWAGADPRTRIGLGTVSGTVLDCRAPDGRGRT